MWLAKVPHILRIPTTTPHSGHQYNDSLMNCQAYSRRKNVSTLGAILNPIGGHLAYHHVQLGNIPKVQAYHDITLQVVILVSPELGRYFLLISFIFGSTNTVSNAGLPATV